MTQSQYRRAMRVLDRAIDSLGPTEACGLMIADGKMVGLLPNDDSNANQARAVLVRAMITLVQDEPNGGTPDFYRPPRFSQA